MNNNNLSYTTVIIFAKTNTDNSSYTNSSDYSYEKDVTGKEVKVYKKQEVEIFTKLDFYKYNEALLEATNLGELFNNNSFIISENSYLERYRYNTLTNTYTLTKHPVPNNADIITYATSLNAENMDIPRNQNELWEVLGYSNAKPSNGEIIGIDSNSYINLSYIIWNGCKFLSTDDNTNLIIREN